MIKIRVPATSANLGPGFDCLGLALNIWNGITFEPSEKLTYHVTGEGAEKLNKGTHLPWQAVPGRNLLTKAFTLIHEVCGKDMKGVKIHSQNEIPMSSGLGSSAAAIMAGMFGANEILGNPLKENEILKLATEMEGHPDNVAPALFGGLVVSVMSGDEIITRRYEIPELTIVIVKPNVQLSTRVARAVLPKSVSRTDAVFNIGRTPLVIDALRNGDIELLQKIMEDRIHQPYRLKHITGGMPAYRVAKQFGAAALSGAGPSLIVFVPPENVEKVKKEINKAFNELGIETRSFVTKPSRFGVLRI